MKIYAKILTIGGSIFVVFVLLFMLVPFLVENNLEVNFDHYPSRGIEYSIILIFAVTSIFLVFGFVYLKVFERRVKK